MKLMRHQEAALERLRSSGGKQLLALPPGAGKTLTAIAYIKEINAKHVLIICPASVQGVWEDELEKWLVMPTYTRVSGSGRTKLWKEPTRFKIVSYETFLRDHKSLIPGAFDAFVADESHKVKSPTAKVSKALRVFASKVPVRILLSGTPLVNGYGDLWNQIEIIRSGSLYGNWYVFRNMHAIMPIPGIPAIRGWRGVQEILKKVEPHMFSVDKNEVQKNLPPVTMVNVPVDLSKQERAAYIKAKTELLISLHDQDQQELTIPNALVLVGRFRQICNGLFSFGFDVSSKADALDDLLETLAGEKVIIFSMYAETIKFLQKRLRCLHVITGETTHRDDILADWRKRGTILLGTQAMSTGLNLQEAHYVIQVDPPWTKAEEDQRIARSWRTGQMNHVTVYNLIATNTIDEHVRNVIEAKASMSDDVASFTMKEIEEML